jgi:hypothetical protein
MIFCYFRRDRLPSSRLSLGTHQGRISPGSVPALRPLLPPVAPAAGRDRLRGGLPTHQPVRLQLQLLPLQEPQPLPPHHCRACPGQTFLKLPVIVSITVWGSFEINVFKPAKNVNCYRFFVQPSSMYWNIWSKRKLMFYLVKKILFF